MNRIIFILISLLCFNFAFCQPKTVSNVSNKTKIDAINKYVEFVNESAHGMFLVNRLLVEYNMQLNKYVDLESEKINNYSNKDLPQDIFEDKDHWFYDVSPYELLRQAKSLSNNLIDINKIPLDQQAQKIYTIIKAANQLRFDMDAVSVGIDLTKKENIDKVYRKLEEGVKLFDDFYKAQVEIDKIVDQYRSTLLEENASFKPYANTMTQLQKSSKLILTKIRAKEVELLDQIIKANTDNITAYKLLKVESLTTNKSISNKLKFSFDNTIKSADDINELSKNFLKNDIIPSKYKYYGRFYYFYNVEIIAKFNKYGSGLAFEMNNIIQQSALPLVKYIEMPHIFQIMYPKKIEKTDVIKSSDDVVSLPTIVKERKVTKNKVMRVDSDVVELQLYDHMIADGDIVSINFNGDWILEKEELEKGSKKVKIQLNPTGKNYILLHADNVGKRPPNTMAISYMFRGSKEEIILKSDDNGSEMIEIIKIK